MTYITTSRKRLLVILIFGTYYLSLYATREISSSSSRQSSSLYMPSQTVWYATWVPTNRCPCHLSNANANHYSDRKIDEIQCKCIWCYTSASTITNTMQCKCKCKCKSLKVPEYQWTDADATILHWEPEATSCRRCCNVQKNTNTKADDVVLFNKCKYKYEYNCKWLWKSLKVKVK